MALRVPIPADASRRFTQRVFRCLPGDQPWWMKHGHQEDVLYVANGQGWIEIEGDEVLLKVREGSALLISPESGYRFGCSAGEFTIVSILAPSSDLGSSPRVEASASAPIAIHEDSESPLPAGADRYFKLLIDPRHGARNVTQFVGFIEKSRAPFHTHTYEEAIYILEGEGIVHIEDTHTPIRPGTSIFLPPGTPHCLENAGPTTLKLLGVFSPPGSPANRMEPA